jgi:hypothetical protein
VRAAVERGVWLRPFADLVRRPPLPPGKTPMDMRAETPREPR